ncbi:MAG: DUF624 domain-containing protein [Butyricicoccaceae bacterium]
MKKKSAEHVPKRVPVPLRFFSTAVDNLWNLIKLNLVFLISCIPIVTIGPALAAMSHITAQMAFDNEEVSAPIQSYLLCFRQSFLRALPAGILTLLIHIVFGSGLLIYGSMMSTGTEYLLLSACSLLVLLLTWGISLHLYPMLAQSRQGHLLTQASIHALERMGRTVLAVLLMIALLLLQFLTFPVSLPITLTLGFSLPALVGSFAYIDLE